MALSPSSYYAVLTCPREEFTATFMHSLSWRYVLGALRIDVGTDALAKGMLSGLSYVVNDYTVCEHAARIL